MTTEECFDPSKNPLPPARAEVREGGSPEGFPRDPSTIEHVGGAPPPQPSPSRGEGVWNNARTFRRRLLCAVAACLALVLLALPVRAADAVQAFSVVASDTMHGGTVLLVRAIAEGAGSACPSFVVNGAAVEGRTRTNPDAERFPITVCEVVAPLDATVTVDGLPAPTLAGHDGGDLHVAMLGDSGCKGGDKQDCANQWPLPAIAAAAAAGNPDLVIHMGDYDYRGTPSRRAAGEPRVYDGCVPSDDVYVSLADLSDWASWKADLFDAARPLLDAAPWVVVRGNHELCSRAGDGWFFLLDPRSALLDPLHGAPGCTADVVQTRPYPLQVAGLALVVLDNADGCDAAAWQDEAAFAYQTRLFAPLWQEAAWLAEQADGPVWLLTHRQTWSANLLSNGDFFDGSRAWQLSQEAALPDGLPATIALVVSGHVHEGQALVFEGERPPHLILGNGGVALDTNTIPLPVDHDIHHLPATGWVLALPDTPSGHGYLSAIVRDAAHWSGTIPGFAPDGTATAEPLLTCTMPLRDGEFCVLPAH